MIVDQMWIQFRMGSFGFTGVDTFWKSMYFQKHSGSCAQKMQLAPRRNWDKDMQSMWSSYDPKGGIQPTSRTQLEKVIIFRYTHFSSLTGDPTDLLDV